MRSTLFLNYIHLLSKLIVINHRCFFTVVETLLHSEMFFMCRQAPRKLSLVKLNLLSLLALVIYACTAFKVFFVLLCFTDCEMAH